MEESPDIEHRGRSGPTEARQLKPTPLQKVAAGRAIGAGLTPASVSNHVENGFVPRGRLRIVLVAGRVLARILGAPTLVQQSSALGSAIRSRGRTLPRSLHRAAGLAF